MIRKMKRPGFGAIEILIPEGEDFLAANRPTMTAAERQAKRVKGTGVNREAAAPMVEIDQRGSIACPVPSEFVLAPSARRQMAVEVARPPHGVFRRSTV